MNYKILNLSSNSEYWTEPQHWCSYKKIYENVQQIYRRITYRSVIYVKLHARTFWETVSGRVWPYIRVEPYI